MAPTTAVPVQPPGSLDAAHARLVHDAAYQFSFAPPPRPPPPPSWLLPMLKAIAAAAPYLVWVFWGLVIAGVLVILAILGRQLLLYRRPAKAQGRPAVLAEEVWRPTLARARALLADADRLAAEGRFDEAAHVLLFRSIDDIEEKRPRLVRPAYTSRDIAVLDALPEAAARALDVIVRQVERSLFGGRGLDATDFAACRKAYEAFAFPNQWSAR